MGKFRQLCHFILVSVHYYPLEKQYLSYRIVR